MNSAAPQSPPLPLDLAHRFRLLAQPGLGTPPAAARMPSRRPRRESMLAATLVLTAHAAGLALLATQTTAAVTMAMLDRCRDIVLNVSATNGAALTAYRRLGFREHGRFVEGFAVRRPAGPLGWLLRSIERLLPI